VGKIRHPPILGGWEKCRGKKTGWVKLGQNAVWGPKARTKGGGEERRI